MKIARHCFAGVCELPLCSSFAEGELPGVSERGSLRREPGSCRSAAAAAPAFLKLQKDTSEAAI